MLWLLLFLALLLHDDFREAVKNVLSGFMQVFGVIASVLIVLSIVL